jgi:putative ABC transport system permease protein
LLIACANVASLLLARAVARAREIAVRISLGATPAQLVWQLLAESALLSFAGGVMGLAMAWTLIHLAPAIVPPDAIPGGSINFSAGVIWFAFAISLLSCLLCGLAPALAVLRSDIHSALKDSSRGSTPSRKSQRFRQAMIVAEASVAVILLASAGIMIESLRDLMHSNPGYDPKNVIIVRLWLPAATYDADRALRFYRQGAERIAALPGVRSVAVSTSLPQLNNQEVRFKEEGAVARGEAELPVAPYAGVGADYFRTLGIPLKMGRFFTDADNESAPPVAIVSETLAARYFPRQNPIGKRLTFNRPIRWQNGEEPVTAVIVGVVGNVTLDESFSDHKPTIYVPHAQNPWSRAVWFVARTEADPAALGSALRTEFMAIDKEQPIDQLQTLEERLQNQAAEPTFQTRLMSSFALVALMLAALGIYGVNAYAVAQRRNEIGLRMALGASRGSVLRQVIGKGMGPTAVGIGLGLFGAVVISFWLRIELVGARPLDPVTFLGATMLLAIVAAVACFIPALTATQIDPAIALRAE